ncbi:MAG: LamG-like jellyroll fold domain-containing protein [Phycisphaerae bacterium]
MRPATKVMASTESTTLALPTSYNFVHPFIATSLEDLNTMKAHLDQQPWKSGYAYLAGDGHSQLTYQMQGPFANVERNPNVNLNQWRSDMTAVFDLSRMWYFTGNAAYAQKAHDILLAWATTQKTFGGQESGLDLGDYAAAYAGGADLLRGTWSGWTAADTATVKNYFENVLWPATAANGNTAGPFNKGLLNVEAGIAIAAFCDDAPKFNHCIDLYLNYPGAGLQNTLATGELGETGRDEGHSYGGLLGMAFISEVAWREGVDLYSAMDNRLLACGEYYARNTLTSDNPFVPFGTVDYTYYANNPYFYTANRAALYLIQNAYKNRLGIATPWIDRKLQQQNVDANNFMYAKTADFTTATPVEPSVRPAVSLASSGLTLTTLGSQTAGRNLSYSNGVWTMTGLGNDVWSNTADDAQFAYQAMTGDCAMVARVTSSQVFTTSAKAGLMIRDSLSAAVSQRGWIGITDDTLMESYMNGWTETWGGSNWAKRSQPLPPGIPYWLKIERMGNLITTYSSQDGTSWAAIESSYYGNLPSTLYIGLFVCAGATTSPTTATFDHVAFTGGTGGLVTAPAAPATTFAEGSGKAITVRWLPSFGATAYDLLRSTTSGSGYTVIAGNLSADSTSYVDTAVAPGTTYYYVVQAKNSAGTSGNSPEFGDSLLPPQMVNLAFSGTATDSANNPANAANAFDQNPGSQWFYTGTSGWLQYDFGANNAQVVKRYTITEADTIPARDPKDWTFLASQDGVNWTTLDSQSGQSFAYIYQQLTFNISNTVPYRYYRLNVTANNGDSTFLHVGELGLWSDVGRTLPDGTYTLEDRQSRKVMDLANGTQAVQQSWTGGNTQQWTIAWQDNGQYLATNVSNGEVIDNGGSSTPGSNLVVNPSNGATSQRWTIVPDSDGYFHFTSANSGLAIDVSGGSNANGANIVQSTYTGANSQLWMPGFSATPQPVPPAPTGLGATAPSIYQVNLSWTASPGAISYNIKRATVSGGPYTTVATGINTTSYQDSYLTADTTYYYVVSAENGSGESTNSAEAGVTTLAGKPAAPTGLTAQWGASQAILNWTVTGGANSYTLKRATTSGGPYTTVATNLATTIYTDTGLTNGSTYYYVVAADNAFGESPDSSEVHITPSALYVQLKFDETAGTTAQDTSGNNDNGTLVNGPTWDTGKINGAVHLNSASSEYVSLPNGVVSSLTSITIATWVNLDTITNWMRIFDFGSGTGTYMLLTPANGNNGHLRFAITTSSSAGEQQINGPAALPTGSWVHVAVTLSGSLGILYVNGAEVARNSSMTLNPASLGATTQNWIGRSQWSADPYFNGRIDDFRIYSVALSASQIQALATTSVPSAPTNLTATASNPNEIDLSWNSVPNATGYSLLRSTSPGGPYTTIATRFTATTYQDVGLSVDPATGTTYYYVVSAEDAGGDSHYSVEASATALPTFPTSVNDLSALPGTDHTILLAWSASPDAASYTISRATAADGTYTTIASGITTNSYSDTTLTDGNAYYYVVDAVNMAGTSDDSNVAVATPTDLQLRYKFDESSGAAAYDASGHLLTGTLINNPALGASGKINTALSLSGSNQYAQLPAGALSALTNFTISAWVNLNTLSTWARIFDFGTGTSDYMFLSPQAGGSNKLRFAITTAGNNNEQQINGTAALPTGAWTFVAVTLSGSTGTLYVNGTQVGTNTAMTLNPAALGNTTQNYLGKSQFSDPYLNGKIDDFRIYSRALSSAEISALATTTQPPAAPTGLAAVSGNAEVRLSWNAVPAASGYNLYRSTTAGGPYTVIAGHIAGTTYTDSSVTDGSSYYYSLRAYNLLDEGPASNETSANPNTPAAFTVSNLNDAGAGSLRQAILNANSLGGNFLLQFAPGLSGTLALASPLPAVIANITLAADSPTAIIIQGSGDLLTINAGGSASLQNIVFSGGPLVNNGSLQILGSCTLDLLTGTGLLTIGGNNTAASLALTPHAGQSSSQSALTIHPNATFDIADQTFVLNYAAIGTDPIGAILPELQSGTILSSAVASDPHLAIGVVDDTINGALSLSTALLGDVNRDGKVDLTDLSTVLNNFGNATPNWTSGNFDHAATIDLTDLSQVLNNFGQSRSTLALKTAPAATGAITPTDTTQNIAIANDFPSASAPQSTTVQVGTPSPSQANVFAPPAIPTIIGKPKATPAKPSRSAPLNPPKATRVVSLIPARQPTSLDVTPIVKKATLAINHATPSAGFSFSFPSHLLSETHPQFHSHLPHATKHSPDLLADRLKLVSD